MGDPSEGQQPRLSEAKPSLVPTQWQPPTCPTPRTRAAGRHSGECMEPLPWEAWGCGAHPSPGMLGCVRKWAGGSEGPIQREKIEAWEPMGRPFRSSPTGPPPPPGKSTPVRSREQTKTLVMGKTCQRKEPAEVAEQGFSWQKQLEEGGKKQAVADLKTQETLKGGQATPRTMQCHGMH